MNVIEENKKNQSQHEHVIPSNIKIPHSYATAQKPTLTNVSSDPFQTPTSILTLDSSANKTPFKTRLRIFAKITTSNGELKRKLALEGSRLSIVFFFADFFLAKQPYNHTVSTFMSNPDDSVKLATEMALVILLLLSFYCLLKTCDQNSQRYSPPSAQKKRNKFFAITTFSAVIIAQSLLIIRLFMTFLVEYLVHIFFFLTCLSLMIECGLRKQNRTIKNVFILLFFLEILGSLAIFLDTLGIMSSVSYSNSWKNYILPIMLIISSICSVFTMLEPCFISYHENMNMSMMRR